MKKWDDFFSEDPPELHDQNVRKTVAPYLEESRKRSSSERFGFLRSWKSLSLASGGLAFVLVFLLQKDGNQKPGFELLVFQDLLGIEGENENIEDLTVIADESFDFEMMENLDVIEYLEDV